MRGEMGGIQREMGGGRGGQDEIYHEYDWMNPCLCLPIRKQTSFVLKPQISLSCSLI